jgi:transcription elongation factor GreA
LKEVILTADGYKKLQQEIDVLRNDKRREVAERIRVAREFGDIAENAEYDDAKNEQAMLEHKIAQLEERILSNESPVGKAIIGHKKGDVVEVTAPRGSLKFKILEIKAA